MVALELDLLFDGEEAGISFSIIIYNNSK